MAIAGGNGNFPLIGNSSEVTSHTSVCSIQWTMYNSPGVGE
jgi:hypothetical protein